MLAQVFAGTSIREAGAGTRVFCDCVYLPTTTNDCFSMCFFLSCEWIRGDFFELPASLVEAFDGILEVKGFSGILLDIAYEIVAVYKIYVCGEQSPSCFSQCLHYSNRCARFKPNVPQYIVSRPMIAMTIELIMSVLFSLTSMPPTAPKVIKNPTMNTNIALLVVILFLSMFVCVCVYYSKV